MTGPLSFHGNHVYVAPELHSKFQKLEQHFGKERAQEMIADAERSGHHNFEIGGEHFHFAKNEHGHIEFREHQKII